MANEEEVGVKVGVDQSTVSAGLEAIVAKVKSAISSMISSLAGLGTSSGANAAKVVGDNASIGASFEALQAKVEGAHAGMMAGFNKLNVGIASFLGVLAGGAAFEHFISEANQYTESVVKLGKMFGVDSDKATTFATALHSVGLSNEQAEGAFRKFEIQVKRNSDGLKALGVDTAGIKAGTISTMDGFLQAIQVVGQYKEGQDQLQVAMTILGTRGMADIQKFLRLTKERMQEAEAEQRSLGLTVTQESLNMSRAYTENMAGVNTVLEAVGKAIAESLMPSLTAMAVWFRSVGPQAVQIMRDIMSTFGVVLGAVKTVLMLFWDTLVAAFRAMGDTINAIFGTGGEGITAMQLFRNTLAVVQLGAIWFRTVLQEVFEVVGGVIEGVVLWLRLLAQVAQAAFHLNFGAAVAAWNKFGGDIEASVKKHVENIVKIAKDGAADAAKAALAAPTDSPTAGTVIKSQGGKSAPDMSKKKKESDDRLALWREELQQMEDMQGPFYENAKRDELKFWQDKLAIVIAGMEAIKAKTGSYDKEDVKLKRQLESQIVADKKAIANEELAIVLKVMQDEIDAAKNNKDKQLQLAHDRTEAIKTLTQGEGLKYQEMLDKELKLKQEWVKKEDAVMKTRDAMIEAHFVHEQELDKMAADQSLALGNITNAQRLVMEQDFENKYFAMKMATLQKERAAHADDITFAAEQDKKIQALQEAHETALTKIANQGVLDREQYALQADKTIESSFSTLFSDLATGTKTVKQAFLDFFKNIADGLAKIASNQVAQQLFGAGSSGGSQISGLMSKIFGGGAAAATPAAGAAGAAAGATGTAADTAHTAATTADTAAITAGTAASTAATAASTADTTIKTTLTTISTTLVTAFTAVVAAANSAAAAMAAMGASGAAGGGGGLSSLFGGLIPSLSVGTAYVPNDSLAFLHKGEAVIPAAYNKAGPAGTSMSATEFHFHLAGPVDTRTMDQLQRAVARGTRRADARG